MASLQKTLTCAIYARVSTRDKGQDNENQLRQLRQYAEKCGYTIAREYTDNASGKTSKRDAFQELLADASKRQFDVVITWALDRLSREGVAATFLHIRQLSEYGVKFESFQEPHFRTTGPAGELMIAVAAWIAEQERLRMSERTKAGLEKARASGKRLGRPVACFDRQKVLDLRKTGLSIRGIASELGINPGNVQRALKAAA